MKNYRLPDNDEWDKIVDEAFSSDEIHTFSENYKMKKYSGYPVRKGSTMKKNNLLMNLTVIATALAVVAVPTGVYIANNMTETKSATQSAQEEQLIEKTASSVAEKENDKIYDIEFGWLPEDFEYNNEESYTYFTNPDKDKIFMISSFVKNLSGEKTENGKALTVRDEYDTDDKTIEIRYSDNYVENSEDKDTTNYGRVATIYFKDTPYELELLVTDDITQDDFKKILENVKLVESDTETAEIYQGETVTETEMIITDGKDDGEVNEGIHQFTEDDIDYDTIYDVAYCWLPEGLEYQRQDSPYGGKFHNWNTNDGMTPMFTKVPEGVTYYEDTGNPEIETTKDEWLLDGKTVSIYYRSTYIPNNPELDFGRIAFIYFDNTPYVLKLYVTDGISEEDFRKIIDNVKLVPSEGETAGIYTPPQNERENTEFTAGSYERLGVPVEKSTIVQVGEEVHEKSPDAWGEVSAKVTGVRFDDDFNGLTTDGIGDPNDYSEYLNADGKLVENVRKWYNDHNKEETFEPETVPVSVMTVSITYTNNGTEPLVSDYCVCPTLQTKTDEYFFMPRIYNIMQMQTKEQSHNSYGYTDTFRYLETDDMHFSFSCPQQASKNNIHLEAGESTEVTLAFIVEDKFRDNLYLSMNDNGFVDLSNIE